MEFSVADWAEVERSILVSFHVVAAVHGTGVVLAMKEAKSVTELVAGCLQSPVEQFVIHFFFVSVLFACEFWFISVNC